MTPQFALVELVVADMAISLTFYRALGLDIPAEADTEPHVDVTAGPFRIAFDTRDVITAMDSGWTPPSGGHRIALAFDCGSPGQVDATVESLASAGHPAHLAPWDAFWGMRYAVVHDPDGNAVDLFAVLDAPG